MNVCYGLISKDQIENVSVGFLHASDRKSLLVTCHITGDYVKGTDIVVCYWREYCDMPPDVLVHSHKTIAISMATMCRVPK